jgi:serine/threonine protein kinase
MDHHQAKDFDKTVPTNGSEAQRADSAQLVLAPGDVVAEGRYRIVSLLGHGAMGCVYEVEHTFMRRRCAMKTLLPGRISDVVIKRFQKEAQAASRLDHPNLVRASDYGMLNGTQPYLVMDLVLGKTLAEYMKESGPMPLPQVLEYFIPICLALDYAHREGVVHRDLKPSNIILERISTEVGLVPKIVDFGIAKLEVVDETALTRVGEIFGTPLYMSPEQCAGLKVGPKSDIYSLGCVLFEMLTGTPPFTGKTSLVVMLKHRQEDLPTLREASLGLSFPSSLEAILAKMLAKDPDYRYTCCMDIAQDLEYLKKGQTEKIAKDHPKASLEGSKEKRKMLLVIPVAVSLLALALLAVAGINQISGVRKDPAAPLSASKARGANAKQVRDDKYAFQDVNPSTFSSDVGGQRCYSFPSIEAGGDLYWWLRGDKSVNTKQALGTFQTPIEAKPILDVGWTVLDHNANFLVGFNDDSLYGAIVYIRSCWLFLGNDENLTSVFRKLNNQSASLKILLLQFREAANPKAINGQSDFTFRPEQVALISKLNALQWFSTQGSSIPDGELSKFNCLSRLKVMAFHKVKSCHATLAKLALNKVISRLSLSGSQVSNDDLKTIGRMKSLRMLDLRHLCFFNVEQRGSVLENLAALDRLQCLCIDSDLLANYPKQLQSLRRFKQLKTLLLTSPNSATSRFVESLKLIIPGCSVRSIKEESIKDEESMKELRKPRHEPEDFCDPLQVNPEEVL